LSKSAGQSIGRSAAKRETYKIVETVLARCLR
jgi:hypothetical protein